MNRIKQLSKDSLIYGIGGAVGKGISFFLLPIYTRIFSPSDYGNIEMLSIIVSLLSAFLVMGLDSAQSFYFFEQKVYGKVSQKSLVSSILQWRLTWGLIVVLIAGTLSPLINNWFFGGTLPLIYFGVSFFGALFSTILNQSVQILRLLYRPWSYIGITVINTILSAGLILLFVLVFKKGILSFFLGSAISSLCLTFLGWYLVREYLDFTLLQSNWWPRLLKFGAPLLPAEIAFYFMSTADRWFIKYYHGQSALGFYSVAAKFALLLAFTIEMFRMAWWPIAMDAMHSDDGPKTFRMIGRLYIGLGVAAVVYLTFLSPWLVRLLTGPAFHQSYSLIGIMSWQSLFYGFYLIGSAGIWKVEKTYITSILMGFAALLNILLNILLVPTYGGMGAAIATSVTYFIWIIVSLFVSEHYWKINFPIFLMLGQIILGAISVAAITWIHMNFVQIFILSHFIALILIISAFEPVTIRQIIHKIKSHVG